VKHVLDLQLMTADVQGTALDLQEMDSSTSLLLCSSWSWSNCP